MFRSIQNTKIGNTLIFLAEKIPHLSLSKTLKLLYILDEITVKKTGVPFTWLDHKVWKYGPVANSIYQEIKHGVKEIVNGEVVTLDSFIKTRKERTTKRGNNEEIYLVPNTSFNDGLFSDLELRTLDHIVKQYGKLTASEIRQKFQEENTLWYQIVKKNELEKAFEAFKNTSNYPIPLHELNNGNFYKEMALKSAYEALHFQLKLKEPETEYFE
ncbi:MAG: Panacea domain-containing protein [Saprospiraceae bacterium]